MTSIQWLEYVLATAQSAGFVRANLPEELLTTLEFADDDDLVQQVLQKPLGHPDDDQRNLVSRLAEAVVAAVLGAAEKGQLFGLLERGRLKYGDRINGVLEHGCEEFRRLSRTFVTFDTELDDLANEDRSLMLYHVLKEAESTIRGLFFPSAGPFRIPVAERVNAMKTALAQCAPSLNTDAFFVDNPVLRHEEAEEKANGRFAPSIGFGQNQPIDLPKEQVRLMKNEIWSTITQRGGMAAYREILSIITHPAAISRGRVVRGTRLRHYLLNGIIVLQRLTLITIAVLLVLSFLLSTWLLISVGALVVLAFIVNLAQRHLNVSLAARLYVLDVLMESSPEFAEQVLQSLDVKDTNSTPS